MNETKVFGEKQKPIIDFIIAAAVNAALLFLCIVVCNPGFESNDDLAMAQIASGARYAPDAHLVFINIIIGKVLAALYVLVPGVSWYVWSQWFLIFLSLTAVTYVLIRKSENKVLLFLVASTLLGIGYECYIALQFTKTAAVVAAAGAILVFYGIEHINKISSYIACVLGGILAVTGSMYRLTSFEMVILIMLGIGVFRLNILWDADFKKFLKNLARYIVPFSCIIVLAFVCKSVDTRSYTDGGEWEAYVEFNKLRAELLDYGFPEYDKNAELYQQLGISKEDLAYYCEWQFGDTELFTAEEMRELVAAKESTVISTQSIKEFLTACCSKLMSFLKERLVWNFLFITMVFFVLNWKKGCCVLAYQIIQTAVIYSYFVLIGRYSQRRVDVSYWITVIMVVLFLMMDEKIEIKRNTKKLAAIIGSVIVIGYIGSMGLWKNVSEEIPVESKENAQLILEEIEKDTAHVYMVTVGSSVVDAAWEVKEPIEKGCLNNYHVLGGWQNRSPVTNAVLENYDIDNPYRDMINNDSVYLIDNLYHESTEIYLQENYDTGAKLVLVKEILGNKIYRAYSGEIVIDENYLEAVTDEIQYELEVIEVENGVKVSGYIFKEGTSTFAQNVYVETVTEDGQKKYYPAVMFENENYPDVSYGRFSAVRKTIQGIMKADVVNVILETEGKFYRVSI